jgi:hypothetical protein
MFNPMSGYCEMKNDYTMMVTDLYSLDNACGAKPDAYNTLMRKCAPAASCPDNCNAAPGKLPMCSLPISCKV